MMALSSQIMTTVTSQVAGSEGRALVRNLT
jgi:hypothetical protein